MAASRPLSSTSVRVWSYAYSETEICRIFDPDGDVVLILPPISNGKMGGEHLELGKDEEPPADGGDARRGLNWQESVDIEDDEKFEKGEIENASAVQSMFVGDTGTDQYHAIKMVVSSRHLILASPVFKAMLGPNFQEGSALRSTGKLQVPLPDDDPVTLSIILNIIHGRPMRVPGKIDLELLTHVSVVVDKYEFHETAALFSGLWVQELLPTVPNHFNSSGLSWLCISWVFDNADIFSRMTSLAARQTKQKIETTLHGLHLPIISLIVDTIDRVRIRGIAMIFRIITQLIEEYQGPKAQCCRPDDKGHACDGMVLGGLLKGLAKAGLWPLAQPPYEGLSFDFVTQSIRGIEPITLCSQLDLEYHGTTSLFCRDFKRSLFAAIAPVLLTIEEGLAVADFRRRG